MSRAPQSSVGRIVEGLRRTDRVSHFTEDYLSMHGVTPLIGRNFYLSSDGVDPGAPLVALLGFATGRLSMRARDVIAYGRFDTEWATIISVLPSGSTPDACPTPLRIPGAIQCGTGRVRCTTPASDVRSTARERSRPGFRFRTGCLMERNHSAARGDPFNA